MKPYLVTFTADMAIFAESLDEATEKAYSHLEEFCIAKDIHVEEYK